MHTKIFRVSGVMDENRKKPGFYLICRLQRSIVAKNPVSEILINDCAHDHHENARDLHESERDCG